MTPNPARLFALSLLSFSLLLGGLPAQAQSLAAAAKEARARRGKPGPGEVKSFTDKDLPGYSPLATDGDEETADSSKKTDGASKGAATSGSRNQVSDSQQKEQQRSEWRMRAENLRSRIQRAEERVRRLDTSRVGGVQIKSCAVGIDASGQSQGACSDWDTLYNRAKESLESAKSALASLEDSARRQGIPAGWLR